MSRHPLLTLLLWLIMTGTVMAAAYLPEVSFAAYQDEKAAPEKKYVQEYYQSFKGKPHNTEALVLTGPDAQEQVQYEPSGLRISLPLGFPDQRPGTGVKLVTSVRGDFEATMSFEILKEPERADAGKKYGTRVSLGVWLDTPEKNEASLSRRIDSNGISQFVSYLSMAKHAAGDAPKPRYLSTAAKTGRLRLVRAGSVLTGYVSESTDGDFILLKEYPYSALPLKSVYVNASTGGPQAAFDVRITDFRLRADALPELPGATLIAAPAPVAVVEAPPAKSRTWLLAGLILGMVFITFAAAGSGVWLFMRRRRVVTGETSSA